MAASEKGSSVASVSSAPRSWLKWRLEAQREGTGPRSLEKVMHSGQDCKTESPAPASPAGCPPAPQGPTHVGRVTAPIGVSMHTSSSSRFLSQGTALAEPVATGRTHTQEHSGVQDTHCRPTTRILASASLFPCSGPSVPRGSMSTRQVTCESPFHPIPFPVAVWEKEGRGIPAGETEARRAHVHQTVAQTPTSPSTRGSLGTPLAMLCYSHFVDEETGREKKGHLPGSQ